MVEPGYPGKKYLILGLGSADMERIAADTLDFAD
jgi:hypothetical protein